MSPKCSLSISECQAGVRRWEGSPCCPCRTSSSGLLVLGHRAWRGVAWASEAGVTPVLGRAGLGWGQGLPRRGALDVGPPDAGLTLDLLYSCAV